MIVRRTVLAAMFLLALAPGRASADTLIVPFWGVNFGGDSGKSFSSAAESKQQTFGASASFFGGGVIGIEADFGYSPDFFGKTDAGGSSVLTMMGNVQLAVPFGGQKGFGVRPYGLAGVGLLRSSADFPGLFDEGDQNSVAWNVGGGVLVFFGNSFGVRFDIRYFQAFDDLDTSGSVIDAPGKVDFTRGSLGFVFRF
jgi:opacity protein-like surface antigen